MDLLWKEKRLREAFLALEDGTVFNGYSVGYRTIFQGKKCLS